MADEGESFHWNQSQAQAFYYFDSASMQGFGDAVVNADWIVAINPKTDVVVGAAHWQGAGTVVPVMGTEGGIQLDGLALDCSLSGTCDYMEGGDSPLFAIWDHSREILVLNEFAENNISGNDAYPVFGNLGIETGLALGLVEDCMGDLGGWSYIDDCSDCVEDSSPLSDDENDPDGDDVCNAIAANDDDDNCPNVANGANETVDADGDPLGNQHDYDNDGQGDACDDDDDNDGAEDSADSADNNANVCSDSDNDLCDDCSSGSYDVTNDGADNESDGLCDLGDTDDDNDGCSDDVDDDQMTWDDDYDPDGTPDDCDAMMIMTVLQMT